MGTPLTLFQITDKLFAVFFTNNLNIRILNK